MLQLLLRIVLCPFRLAKGVSKHFFEPSSEEAASQLKVTGRVMVTQTLTAVLLLHSRGAIASLWTKTRFHSVRAEAARINNISGFGSTSRWIDPAGTCSIKMRSGFALSPGLLDH